MQAWTHEDLCPLNTKSESIVNQKFVPPRGIYTWYLIYIMGENPRWRPARALVRADAGNKRDGSDNGHECARSVQVVASPGEGIYSQKHIL
jgi:hypothetical protein